MKTMPIALTALLMLSIAHAERIPGDVNGDGEVTFSDFVILARNFGRKGGDPAPEEHPIQGTWKFKKDVFNTTFGFTAVYDWPEQLGVLVITPAQYMHVLKLPDSVFGSWFEYKLSDNVLEVTSSEFEAIEGTMTFELSDSDSTLTITTEVPDVGTNITTWERIE